MANTHGSLFSGYGGLDQAVEAHFGAETIWHCEFDPAASKVLAAQGGDTIPNLKDITKVQWRQVQNVTVVSGGSPCQDMSPSGKLAGMMQGTRSGLWLDMLKGIKALEPQYVVWENVKGALSAKTHRDDLKALGLVLGDLHEAGYDANWVTVGADEVGAPHRRDRVFVLATKRQDPTQAVPDTTVAVWDGEVWDNLTTFPPCGIMRQGAIAQAWGRTKRANSPLPTPAASDWRSNNYPADLRRRSPRITAHGAYFPRNDLEPFGGREHPEPTFVNARGKEELSPAFVEWMMGLPQGHVTGTELSRKDVHQILGNGVVPQQAKYALRLLSDPQFGPEIHQKG